MIRRPPRSTQVAGRRQRQMCIRDRFEGVISLRDYDMLSILALGVILTGIVLNLISTYFAVNKYLNIKTDKLY